MNYRKEEKVRRNQVGIDKASRLGNDLSHYYLTNAVQALFLVLQAASISPKIVVSIYTTKAMKF